MPRDLRTLRTICHGGAAKLTDFANKSDVDLIRFWRTIPDIVRDFLIDGTLEAVAGKREQVTNAGAQNQERIAGQLAELDNVTADTASTRDNPFQLVQEWQDEADEVAKAQADALTGEDESEPDATGSQ